ncbi:Sulfatase [uncultured archaeon]|nr:Sulfatase [uncultured archaeon]
MQNKEKKPNILFLSIDALRAKNLGCFGYNRNTSPNIDSYSKEGVQFNNFFSSYNNTHKSFLSVLGGRHILAQDFELYPSKNEMNSFFNTGGVLLPEILKRNGYKTFFLRKLFGWEKIGFDYYYEQESQDKSKKWSFIRFLKKIPAVYNSAQYALHHFYFIPKKLESDIRFNPNGEKSTEEAIKKIKENKDNPFFLWLHYSEAHLPYIFPHSFRNKFVPEKKGEKIFDILKLNNHNPKDISFLKNCWKANDTVEDVIAQYDTAVSYEDFLISKIINTLKDEKLLENTIIFIFADHGISLGEHNVYSSNCGAYDESFNIPLIIYGDGVPKDRKINSLAQLEDIAPTVLDLIGIKYDPLFFDGESLLPLINQEKKELRNSILLEESVNGLRRRALRTLKYKYMESPDPEHLKCALCNTTHGERFALYDLENDPQETINLAEKDKKNLNLMKKEMENFIKYKQTLNEQRRIKTLVKKWKQK